jgi:hypothetical protein
MRGFSADSAENIPHRGLSGGARGIRTPGAARAYLGGIRPEFGALFGPNKSIVLQRICSPGVRLCIGSLRFPSFVRLMLGIR